jgi:hypothetical protein
MTIIVRPKPEEVMREATFREFYGNHIFEWVDRSYYSFAPEECGDSAWLVKRDTGEVEALRVAEDNKFPPNQIVPALCSFEHSVSYDATLMEDRAHEEIESRMLLGGETLAHKANRAFVEVLLASVTDENKVEVHDKLDDALAETFSESAQKGFRHDVFLFPEHLLARLVQQQLIVRDTEIDSPHYLGTAVTGHKSFWSGELPSDTAIALDSRVGITLKGEAKFQARPGKLLTVDVHGRLELNPLVKNTEGIVALVGVQEAISNYQGVPHANKPGGGTDQFFSAIKDEIAGSSIEPDFKKIAVYDLGQARRAYEAGAYKACVVMLGAVLEGLILGTLRREGVLEWIRTECDIPKDISQKLHGIQYPAYREDSMLANALADELSFEDYRKLIRDYIQDIDQLGVQDIQSFRNAIHPWKVVQNPTIYGDYDQARALNHLSSLVHLTRHLLSASSVDSQ